MYPNLVYNGCWLRQITPFKLSRGRLFYRRPNMKKTNIEHHLKYYNNASFRDFGNFIENNLLFFEQNYVL